MLGLLGMAGGGGAVYGALRAWDLVGGSPRERPPDLPADERARSTRVIILGAGPAGLTAAWELSEQGYVVQILEATDRVAGRVFTVRGGTRISERDGAEQVAVFDEGHYFEAGAWRIPYSHRGLLHYYRAFGLPLITHKNLNLNAFAYVDADPTGTKLRLRELRTDMAGYVSEVLAKAVDQRLLDLEFTDQDAELLIEYLIAEGQLSPEDLSYSGSSRRGYLELPGAGDQPGVVSNPIPPLELLPFAAETMRWSALYLAATAGFDQQETMLEPVGGMATLWEQGFHPRLAQSITLNAEVVEIRQSDSGVRVVHRDRASGEETETAADYCICTIPLPVLREIPADFSEDFSAAISSVQYLDVGKSGIQFRRRFWEEDDWIYGGITYTNIPEIVTIAYPDYGFQSAKGVVQAYYHFGEAAAAVGDLPPGQRIELALKHGEKIHPQYRDEFEHGASVAWQNMPYQRGGWATFGPETAQHYPRLLEPDGRVYLAGDHLSYLPGWQEGAIQSAWLQIEKLHERVMGE
jgi:monoamine oxidase